MPQNESSEFGKTIRPCSPEQGVYLVPGPKAKKINPRVELESTSLVVSSSSEELPRRIAVRTGMSYHAIHKREKGRCVRRQKEKDKMVKQEVSFGRGRSGR